MKVTLVVLIAAVPVVLGLAVARVVSLDTWGYAGAPPKLQLDEGHLVALSFARFSGGPPSRLDRAEILAAMSPERCQSNEPSDCALGRSLWSYLNGASTLPEADAPFGAIDAAEKTGRFFTGSGGRCGTAMVAEIELKGQPTKATIVGFQSCELFEDRHRYSEVLMVDGVARQQVAYSFDVSGVEFATPRVLAALSLGAFAIAFLSGGLAQRLVSGRRSMQAPKDLAPPSGR